MPAMSAEPTNAVIRPSTPADHAAIRSIHRAAFGSDVEADLALALIGDPTAQPAVSLVALDGGAPVGHVLFSAARLARDGRPVPMALLAPVAVVPEKQRLGIGRRLIEEGLTRLRRGGCAFVFVMGDPAYYRRFGFEPALPHGIEPPYPIADAYREAWMARATGHERLGSTGGTVLCADAIMKPDLWAA